MKHNLFTYTIIFIVAVLCGTAVLAQVDDQGNSNDPRTSSRANACFAGGTLAESCVTQAQWDCGWSLIRFEYGLLTNLPATCASLFPNVTTSTGQNPFHAVTAFYANATSTPSLGIPVEDDICIWTPGTQTQEWLAQYAQSKIQTLGYSSSVSATSYGENCLNQNGDYGYFATQYTAFDVTVTIPANTDEGTAKTTITTAINNLTGIPGAFAPQITFHFVVDNLPTPTPIYDPYPSCNWWWARQPRPDLAQQASAAVGAAGYAASVNAYLYGEDCYTRSGQWVYFAAMDTNFDVTVTVDANTNQGAVQQAVNAAIRGLSGMPTSKVNINVNFVVANPTVVPTLVPTNVATEEATPEASPEIDPTTPEPTAPTEEASPVVPMPTATPRTGDCKETDPCGAA